MEGATRRTQASQQGLSSPPRGPSVSRRPPQQGSNISSQNFHPNQLKRSAAIEHGNHSKLEKQAEAEQTLTRMVEKTWVGGFNTSNNTTNNTTTELKPTTTQHPAQTAGKMSIKQQIAKYNNLSQGKLLSSGQPTTRNQGHHPRMVTIIPLSPGCTQKAFHTIRICLGGPSPRSYP